MKYGELLAQIEKGQFAPVYLFVGEEDFLKEEAIRRIKAALVDSITQNFNLDVFYGGEGEVTRVVNVASSPPLLAQRRLVILKEINRLSPSDRRVLLSYVQNPSPTTCLLLVGPKVDLEKGFFRQLSQQTVTVIFWRLFEEQIPDWIRERVREKGKRISSQAAGLLQEKVGNDLWTLDNEIEKLMLYVGPREQIELEDVNLVTGGWRMDTVFNLSDAIGDRDLVRALHVLGQLLESGESPTVLVTMLTQYFASLLRVKELDKASKSPQEVARLANIRAFLIKDYIRRARNFSLSELKQAFELLLEADTRLKSGYQSPKMVMELLVYGLCKP